MTGVVAAHEASSESANNVFKLVVRRTFLHVELPSILPAPARQRCCTDPIGDIDFMQRAYGSTVSANGEQPTCGRTYFSPGTLPCEAREDDCESGDGVRWGAAVATSVSTWSDIDSTDFPDSSAGEDTSSSVLATPDSSPMGCHRDALQPSFCHQTSALQHAQAHCTGFWYDGVKSATAGEGMAICSWNAWAMHPGAMQPSYIPWDQGAYQSQAGCFTPSSQCQETPQLSRARPSVVSTAASASEAAVGSCNADDGQEDTGRTTVLLREIPREYSREQLIQLIDAAGFAFLYDFVYLPVDFKSGSNLGYAFANLILPEEALRFRCHFEGFTRWGIPGDHAPCSVGWCMPQQGLPAHIERYRNSPVMHSSVPEEWRPVIFSNGVRIPFPPPTTLIKAPKVKKIRTVMQ